MSHSLFLLLLSFLFLPLQGARILFLLPVPLKSHYSQIELLIDTLATRGHQVTLYSPFEAKSNLTNLHHVYVDMEASKRAIESMNHFEMLDNGLLGDTSFLSCLQFQFSMYQISLGMSKEILNKPAIRSLLASDARFDLIIAEFFFGQEPLAVFGHKFQAPMISHFSHSAPGHVFQFSGTPNLYSYMPDIHMAFPKKMSFMQRLQNTMFGVFNHMALTWWVYPAQDQLMREFAGTVTPPLPYIKTLLVNISATLVYSDPMIEYPRPQTANLVQVGGMHLKTGQLPKDLADLMSSTVSPRGVILVSFGSMVSPSKMSSSLRDSLVRAFASTELTVLWRWEGKTIENLPANIHLRKWVPQQDVLAHPNCRLFISHGGLNSVLESIHYAVPMVGIPFYGDQPSNIKHMVDLGSAVELEYHNMTEKSIVWAANTILNNRRFKFAAIQARQRFNDRQVPPLHNAVWWVEYVLRHHGAPHLRSAFDHLSWTEFLLLDVVAFVLGVLLVILYLLLRIVRAVKSCLMYPFRGTGNEKTKTIKKKGKVE
uniref:UDP-glucuronosyltransferase 2C1 n=1 Tax=Cacopsylla melanoneura TaxID=428564 RepID=A0A8D8QQD5_9HEMI